MSLTRTVAQLVHERGSATVDDLTPILRGHTRRQIIKAMENAQAAGLIRCEGRQPRRGIGGGRGTQPSAYVPDDRKPPPRERPRRREYGQVSSVWDYAQQQGARA